MEDTIFKILETEHGIFTENEELGKTAEECYQQWLIDKDKPSTIEPQITETEQLKQELITVQEALDFLIMNGGV